MDMTPELKKLALARVKQSFKEESLALLTENDQVIEGLGLLIARWADWELEKIVDVFSVALNDSNFHDLTDKIRKVAEI